MYLLRMCTEKQKYLIFDINCFYQLESQSEKISSGQPIETLPELSIFATKISSGDQEINWPEKQAEINQKLIEYGFSENWLLELKKSIKNQLNLGKTPEEFRLMFLKPINLLTSMLVGILENADPEIPKQKIAESVINDIFEKDHWEGPVVQQVNMVRTLSTNLNLDKSFTIEFGQIFVNQ